jgi:hypothetical protein
VHHLDDVVDHQHADEPPLVVGDGGRNEVVLAELVGHVFLLVGDLEHRVVGLHQVGDGDFAPAAQDARQGHRADEVERRVDDIDFDELVRQLPGDAHVVDGVADRPEGGNGHELGLHQPAGGAFGEVEGAAQRLAVDLGQLAEDLLAVGLVEVLDQVERVVGVEAPDGGGDHVVGQRLHQVVAHRLVEFRQRLDVEAAPEQMDELDPLSPTTTAR